MIDRKRRRKYILKEDVRRLLEEQERLKSFQKNVRKAIGRKRAKNSGRSCKMSVKNKLFRKS